MKTMNFEELKERAIHRIVFNYTNKFGLRSRKGDEAFWMSLQTVQDIFGSEIYHEIAEEAKRRVDEIESNK